MKSSPLFKFSTWTVLFSFFFSLIAPPRSSAQESFSLPDPGTMITVTPAFVPPMLKGMKVNLEDPFAFDFIFDSGNANLTPEELKSEANKLIKYFLASLTIPEDDLWVNLSPYEKDRVIPKEFGVTEMGRDLLGQDYILKQLTASLIYPEKDLGKEFWNRVFSKARALYGTEAIPIKTFNKVWILPDKAVVYQNQDTVFVLESHLKVMLEGDYLSLKENLSNKKLGIDKLDKEAIQKLNDVSAAIIKEVVIPEIEKEVNSGQNFAKLRQVYHSLILAKWYKQNLKASILNWKYSDKRKVVGVDVEDKSINEKIYEQYLEAFKKGVFNYIKEDYDVAKQEVIPRKYFSGGIELKVPLEVETDPAMLAKATSTGKLNWIKGIYRQPRVSARFVNEYINQKFREGAVKEGQPIDLPNGKQAQVYTVKGLLKSTGQFGHIGLGAKERKGAEVVYTDGGLPVIYLDSDYAENLTVRDNEKFKVERWEEQKIALGRERGLSRPLTAQEMRQWIKNNTTQAAELLQEWDSQAPSLVPLFEKAEAKGLLPSDEEIAETYTREEDFRDLNLAAGRWGIRSASSRGIMPQHAAYTVEAGESYDDIVIKELAKQSGVSVDDLEANFERTVSMLEESLGKAGFSQPNADVVAKKIHEIFDRLIKVYQTKTQEAPGRLRIVDANTVNAFVIRKRADVYFYKGLYEALYDISTRMNVPLTEDMIAFIIAHELSHALQHTSRQGLDIRDLNEKASPYLIQMIKNGEYDADMRALELMDKAGYSVFGAVDAMTFLEFITGTSQAENVLSSHPYVSLRKHRLSQIIFDQKTNVFTNVKASRVPMVGNGRIRSQDVDFRHLMDKSEEELLAMAQNAESLVALDELTGMLVLRKRMNALKGLVREDQLKAAFLRDVYVQAVLAATGRTSQGIDYSDMKGAAAIYDFGKETTTENVLERNAPAFEDNPDDVIKKINESLKDDASREGVAAKNVLEGLISSGNRRVHGLTQNDFDGFLLPFEDVKDIIPIFTKRKGGLRGVFVSRQEGASVDQTFFEDAMRDPQRLISAFFYANYLGQEPSVEFGIPTTEMRVKLQRRKNEVYFENPAYRDTGSAENRRHLQNIVLLHYALAKTRSNIFDKYLDVSFPGIKRLLQVPVPDVRQLFDRYETLFSKKYPQPIATQLAGKRLYDYFGVKLEGAGDAPTGFINEVSNFKTQAKSEYAEEEAGFADYMKNKVGEFVDSHPLIIFMRKAIQQYRDRLSVRDIEKFEETLDQLRTKGFEKNYNSHLDRQNISNILTKLAVVYSQEPRREAHVSAVFANETSLDYYLKEEEILSFKSLLELPDWAVSDYLNRKSYSANKLIENALKQGTPLSEIFAFMGTRLAYADRREVFDSLFLGWFSENSRYLFDFFKTKLNNNSQEIIVWFLGMFSKKDALELIDKFSRGLLYERAKDARTNVDEAAELRNLAIALLEYIYRQTSKTFHADEESAKVYLDLINERIEKFGKSGDQNYVREAVYNALMVLSASVALKIEFSQPEEPSEDGTPDFKYQKTSLFKRKEYFGRWDPHNN